MRATSSHGADTYAIVIARKGRNGKRKKKISSKNTSSSPRRTAIFCFSRRRAASTGRKVYELPEAAAATRGKAISSLVKFQEDEKLTALVAARSLEEADKFVFMATKNGT